MANYQPPVALYVLFLYSDDGTHFKHHKILHKMTSGLVLVIGWPLNTGKNNKQRQTLDCLRVVVHMADQYWWLPNKGEKDSVCRSEKPGLKISCLIGGGCLPWYGAVTCIYIVWMYYSASKYFYLIKCCV